MINSHRVLQSNGFMVYYLHDEDVDNPNNDIQDLSISAEQQIQNDNTSMNMNQENNIGMIEESFNEMQYDTPMIASLSRINIILDGANIGWNYGIDRFNIKGIELALEYIQECIKDDDRSYCFVVFLPSSYARKKPDKRYDHSLKNVMMEDQDYETLHNLINSGIITLVPPGNNDDEYIISYARDNNGFIISNDFFIDHIQHIQNSLIQQRTKEWLQSNTSNYTFINQKQFMLNPSSNLYLSLHFNSKQNIYSKSVHIHTLTQTINLFMFPMKSNELKHLLIARAYLLIHEEYYLEAKYDLEFIFQNIDSNCKEAQELYLQYFKDSNS